MYHVSGASNRRVPKSTLGMIQLVEIADVVAAGEETCGVGKTPVAARPIPLEYDAFHTLTKIIFILDSDSDGKLAFDWDWRRASALKIHA